LTGGFSGKELALFTVFSTIYSYLVQAYFLNTLYVQGSLLHRVVYFRSCFQQSLSLDKENLSQFTCGLAGLM